MQALLSAGKTGVKGCWRPHRKPREANADQLLWVERAVVVLTLCHRLGKHNAGCVGCLPDVLQVHAPCDLLHQRPCTCEAAFDMSHCSHGGFKLQGSCVALILYILNPARPLDPQSTHMNGPGIHDVRHAVPASLGDASAQEQQQQSSENCRGRR